MRYFFSLSSLVLGIVLLLVGFGQRTFLAIPENTEIATDATSKAAYAVLSAQQLQKIPGTTDISLGHAGAVIAVGAEEDVLGWVKPLGYTELKVDAESKQINYTSHDPQESNSQLGNITVQDSDLWHKITVGDGSKQLSSDLELRAGQAVLLATTSDEALGQNLRVAWYEKRTTPWAGPLLVAGAFFSLLGLILYIVFVDRDKRGLGPRRGRRGPLVGIRSFFVRKTKVDPVYAGGSGSKSGDENAAEQQTNINSKTESVDTKRKSPLPEAAKLVSIFTVSTLALSGCSADYWPQPDSASDAAAQTENLPTVVDTQLSRIINDISSVSVAADTDLNSDLLQTRFTGDALEQRAKNYQIRKAFADYSVVPPYLLADRLGYELVQDTDNWPRSMLVTVASSTVAPNAENGSENDTNAEASPSMALLLTQTDAHSNYKVSHLFALQGGVQMPEAAPVEEGTTVLDNEIATLKIKPTELPAKYAAVLQEGTDNAAASLFNLDGDAVFGRAGAAWIASESERTAEQEGEAKHSVSFETDSTPIAFSTGTGGALVAVTITELRKTEASDNSELPVGDVIAAVSELEGNTKTITQRIAHQLIFFVPKANSEDSVQLLGSTSELIGATE